MHKIVNNEVIPLTQDEIDEINRINREFEEEKKARAAEVDELRRRRNEILAKIGLTDEEFHILVKSDGL